MNSRQARDGNQQQEVRMIDPRSQIRAHLERAAQLDSEARRHRQASGLLLAEVRAENASQGFWWRDAVNDERTALLLIEMAAEARPLGHAR